VYEQIFRVLKPGGSFGVFEWVMTDKYDDTNQEHRAIRLGIERGDGIANMMTREHAVEAIKAAGFTLEHAEDLATRPDRIPWYYPLAGELQYVRGLWDLASAMRLTRLGRSAFSTLLRVLEACRVAPSGTAETADELALAADNLVAGGQQGLFTPMYFMIGRKPALDRHT
jgi:sterol 24-C-methyltransferase